MKKEEKGMERLPRLVTQLLSTKATLEKWLKGMWLRFIALNRGRGQWGSRVLSALPPLFRNPGK